MSGVRNLANGLYHVAWYSRCLPALLLHGSLPLNLVRRLYSYRKASAMGTLAAWREGTIVIRSEAKKAKAEISAIWNQGMA